MSLPPLQHRPLVEYGVENKNIPGDPGGWKLKECGNICHWDSEERLIDFLNFDQLSLRPEKDPDIEHIRAFLSELAKDGVEPFRRRGTVIRDTQDDLVVKCAVQGLSARIVQYRDVDLTVEDSLRKADRARRVAQKSRLKMEAIEPALTRAVEDYMMADRITRGEAPSMPLFRDRPGQDDGDDPMPREDPKQWFKTMRADSNKQFWVGTSRAMRDEIRQAATKPPPTLSPALTCIAEEDDSRSQDVFWEHQRDEAAAAAGEDIYETLDEDIVAVLDKAGVVLVCRVRGLFQTVFGEERMRKADEAVRKWSALPPLPVPDARRHMVDDWIRTRHPELDLEKARTVAEVEQRHQCVVHYGTWAARGRRNPDHVYPTPDAILIRGRSRAVMEDSPWVAFPIFRTKVLGLASEVARLVVSSIDPREYQECLEVFEALPEHCRMSLAEPNFVTMAVLGINAFTGRHKDATDVARGLATLVALGDYTGGDLCFPELGIKLPYQPGDCASFRGAELEHFVADWTGYRIFLLFTNHQPVRNYAHRVLGRLPPKPNDPWHPDRVRRRAAGERTAYVPPSREEEEELSDPARYYDPCQTDVEELEPEELTEEEFYGAAIDVSESPSASSSSSAAGDAERGASRTVPVETPQAVPDGEA
ncbi:hypothetical protein GGR56DRAFT_684736 [Xylariaceae sp. FL0804]|nr:hypothetical protein GGR56DRAFT_684736 [Xylariaceae sp. FL0804]